MRRIAILAAVLVMAAGCQNDSTSPTVNIVGTYRLETVNGQNLPFTFTDNSGNYVTVNSDQLVMQADGSYQDTANLTDNSGTYPSTEYGTYTAVNGSITFNDQADGIQYGGSLSGSILTEIIDNGALTEVFQKQ